MIFMKLQKEIAARILKCGKSRIWMDPSRIEEIEEAITNEDVRRLIRDGVIKAKPKLGISTYRKKKRMIQKKKGRRKGRGSKKGTKALKKKIWISRIRAQRKLLKELRSQGKIDKKTFRIIYKKSKGGFFRSKAHLMAYLEKENLIKKEKETR